MPAQGLGEFEGGEPEDQSGNPETAWKVSRRDFLIGLGSLAITAGLPSLTMGQAVKPPEQVAADLLLHLLAMSATDVTIDQDAAILLAWVGTGVSQDQLRRKISAAAIVAAAEIQAGDPAQKARLQAILTDAASRPAALRPSGLGQDASGVGEKLALAAYLAYSFSGAYKPKSFSETLKAFAEAAGVASPAGLDTVSKVSGMLIQAEISPNTDDLVHWQNESILALLQPQAGWQDLPLIRCAAGGDPSSEWKVTLADGPAGRYLRNWLSFTSVKLPENGAGDGGLRRASPGNRPVGAHPLLLGILRKTLLKGQDDTIPWNSASKPDAAAVQDYLGYVAAEAVKTPDLAFSGGAIVLASANAKGVKIGSGGTASAVAGTPDDYAHWVNGVLSAMVAGSALDGGGNPAWKDSAQRLDTLYKAVPLNLLAVGGLPLDEMLYRVGAVQMASAWSAYNSQAALRISAADKTGGDFRKVADEAAQDRGKIDVLMKHPLCSAGLPSAAQSSAPTSLESGMFLRWHMGRMMARARLQAIDTHLSTLANPPAGSVAPSKIDAVESFAAWEGCRGIWMDLPAGAPASAALLSPWSFMADDPTAAETAVARVLTDRLPADYAAPNPSVRTALAAISILGAPSEQIKTIADGLHDNDTFLLACRLQLAATVAAQGDHVETVLNSWTLPAVNANAVLLGNMDKLLTADASVGPLAVRSAVDILLVLSALLGSQASQSVLIGLVSPNPNTFTLSQCFAKVNPLMRSAQAAVRQKKPLSGNCLRLLVEQARLEFALGQTGTAHTQVTDLLSLAAGSVSQGTAAGSFIGTGPLGADLWLEAWQYRLDELQLRQMASIRPGVLSDDDLRLREIIQANLGAALACLGAPLPAVKEDGDPLLSFAAQRCLLLPPRAAAITVKDKNAPVWELNPPDRPLSPSAFSLLPDGKPRPQRLLPYTPSRMRAGEDNPLLYQSIQPLAERAGKLESASIIQAPLSRPILALTVGNPRSLTDQELQELPDSDGYSSYVLPSDTYAAGQNKLTSAVANLTQIEDLLLPLLGDTTVVSAIRDLQPLLAVPVAVDLAGFRKDTEAAVAEVRRAEHQLNGSQYALVAAKLEAVAKDYFSKMASVEVERTGYLQDIAKKQKDLATKYTKITNLQKEIAAGQGSQDDLNLLISQDEVAAREFLLANWDIKVAADTHEYAAAQQQVQAIYNLIVQQTTADMHPIPGKGSQLSEIAVEAGKQVAQYRSHLLDNLHQTEEQLHQLQEAAFFRGLFKFIGAVVGAVIGAFAGNPALGAQIGGMAGENIGAVIADIEQGKPFLQIAEQVVSGGIAVFESAGVDVKGALTDKIASLTPEVQLFLSKATDIVETVQKQLPDFSQIHGFALDNVAPQAVFQAAYAVRDLGTEADNFFRHIQLGWSQFQGDIGADASALKTAVEKQVKEALLPLTGDIETLKALANQLQIPVAALAGALQQQNGLHDLILENTTNFGIVRSAKIFQDECSQSLGRFATAMVTLQSGLDQAKPPDVGQWIATHIAALLPSDQTGNVWIAAEVTWLKRQFTGVNGTAGALPYTVLEDKIVARLRVLFPNDPITLEQARGRFAGLLDRDGKQAEIKRLLIPWEKTYTEKLARVQKLADQAVNEGEQEVQLKQAINNQRAALAQLDGDTLPWLQKPDSPEVNALRTELAGKKNKLEADKRQLNIDNNSRKYELGQLNKAKLGVTITEIQVEIGKKTVAIADYKWQDSVTQGQIADLDVLNAHAHGEEALAGEMASRAIAGQAAALVKAADEDYAAAAAALDGAHARAEAAMQRAAVYGRIQGWYDASLAGPPSNILDPILQGLRKDYAHQVSAAFKVVRDQLRLLRSFNLPNAQQPALNLDDDSKTWKARVQDMQMAIETNYTSYALGNLFSRRIPLTKDNLASLFSSAGLTLQLEPLPPRVSEPIYTSSQNMHAAGPLMAGPNLVIHPIPSRASNMRVILAAIVVSKPNEASRDFQMKYQGGATALVQQNVPINHLPPPTYRVEPRILPGINQSQVLISTTISRPNSPSDPDEGLDNFLQDYLVGKYHLENITGLIKQDTFSKQLAPPAAGTFTLTSNETIPDDGYLVLLISYTGNNN